MKKTINPVNAPAPIGPYSRAIQAGNTIYTSGNIALNANGELYVGNIKTETEIVMNNLRTILEAAGATFGNVVKASIFIADMNDFAAINEVYATYFTANFPARETVQVSRLPKDARVEISVIAVL